MLSIMEEEAASPKELAEHFGVPLSNVAYHIQVLRKLKLIRLVKKTPRRGAVEHHYMVDHAVAVVDDTWSQTPRVIKERLLAGVLEDMGEEATQAAATGGFNRTNAHITRTHVVLDEEAWDVLSARLLDLLHGIGELEAESADRLRRVDHEGERRTSVVMMMFEPSPSVPDADAAHHHAPRAPGLAESRARPSS
jgi:predicted transcriptional regulator